MMTRETLREAALQHLARYATTRMSLLRILHQKIARYMEKFNLKDESVELRRTARDVVDGLVNDVAYGEMRVRRLLRAGRSRRAVAADLAARGVPAVMVSEDTELAAALATAKRRRIGPFRAAPIDAEGARRETAILARAGFPRDVVRTALQMDAAQAEGIVLQLKRG
jgi:regulatory protein